ncbi:Short-chain dehydrogenase/reductase SDR [Sesbania bispinosa]|nr:Short-chain dehydrogenase/reductase SDR [Sesbania bispinosa]
MYAATHPIVSFVLPHLLPVPLDPSSKCRYEHEGEVARAETTCYELGGIDLAHAHRAAAEGGRVSILALSLDKLDDSKNTIRLALRCRSIIGGSSVISLALANRAASEGAHVSILACLPNKLYDALERAVDEAGPIDVLLLNHRVFVALELEKMKLSEVKFTMDVNMAGRLNMMKVVLPAMRSRKDPLPAYIALMSSQAAVKYSSFLNEFYNSAIISHEELKKIVDELLLVNGVLNIGDFVPWINFLDMQEDPALEVKLERHGVKAFSQKLQELHPFLLHNDDHNTSESGKETKA